VVLSRLLASEDSQYENAAEIADRKTKLGHYAKGLH
jgi:hypothetical protein